MKDPQNHSTKCIQLFSLEDQFDAVELPTPRSSLGTPVFAALPSAALWRAEPTAAEVTETRARHLAKAEASKSPERWTEIHAREGARAAHLAWTATPLLDKGGSCIAHLVEAADVTELVEAQADLEARHQRLEVFSHSVAHTLKTDWQGVGLLVDEIAALLEESKGGELPLDDIEALFADLGARAARGAQTVRDLLAYATATGKPEFESLPLREVLEGVVARVGSKTIRIGDEVPREMFRLDKETFPVALLQLVENAVKYGEGKPVDITYSGRRLRIQDHGRGIPSESLAEIFGLFTRVAKDVSGTGLGLAICRQILDVHGYRVWAESEGPGKGSAFVIDFGPEDGPASAGERRRNFS